MRGVIAIFDAEASVGTIRGKDGKFHPFARSSLMRRSREPRSGRLVAEEIGSHGVCRIGHGPRVVIAPIIAASMAA
jgi:hypothetical protein